MTYHKQPIQVDNVPTMTLNILMRDVALPSHIYSALEATHLTRIAPYIPIVIRLMNFVHPKDIVVVNAPWTKLFHRGPIQMVTVVVPTMKCYGRDAVRQFLNALEETHHTVLVTARHIWLHHTNTVPQGVLFALRVRPTGQFPRRLTHMAYVIILATIWFMRVAVPWML